MARVVVVGGGLGGIASAARLAKNGHDVVLVERATHLGGALAPVEQDGFTWDSGATSTLVPAVVRDLFRKTGRTIESELGTDLVPLEILREHRFEDGTSVALPSGSRLAQRQALDALDAGLGRVWVDWVDSYAAVWDVLRRSHVEVEWAPPVLPREAAALLESRAMLHKTLRRAFRDDRLVLVAGHPFLADGHDLRNVPAWAGVTAYLEQTFGAWTLPGGLHRLSAALVERLATRGVRVVTDVDALDLVVRDGRVVAVRTTTGELEADVVVCAVDPRRLPTLAPYVERTMPAMPPVVTHLGLDGDVPDLAAETVLHGDPTLVVRTGGTAPPGHQAWTLHGRGKLAEDTVTALARAGVDVRDHVVTRLDRSPRELVSAWGGSPHGVLWQGRGTVRARLGPTTPITGVFCAGAHARPGAGVPFVGLSAAGVAAAVGAAR